MRPLLWVAWHLARWHRLRIGRPYDAPIGIVAHCRCGDNRQLI